MKWVTLRWWLFLGQSCLPTYFMCRLHGGALRIHPTNDDLKHLCVAASVSIFIAKTITLWISLLPIWMTACLLLFYRTISTFFVVFCLNAILIRTVLGLGAMNMCWQPSVEAVLQDNCLKICIDILFSCVQLFFKDQSEMKIQNT